MRASCLTANQLNRHFDINLRLDDGGAVLQLPVVAANCPVPENFRTGSGTHTSSCLMGTGIFSRECSGRDLKLTVDLHLALRLRMGGGAMPYLPTPYAFMAS